MASSLPAFPSSGFRPACGGSFFFLISGIVLLTLLVNATTVGADGQCLGLDEVARGQEVDVLERIR